VDFSGIGSDVIKDIHVYDNYLLTCSERSNAGQVIVGAITFDGVLASYYIIPKPFPTAVAINTWGNYMFITGRQSNGINGKDVFFMKFNLDSLFIITGHKDYAVAPPVKIYPNPADDRIYIGSNGPAPEEITGIRMFSISGCLEQETRVSGRAEQSLRVTDLPRGLYLMVIDFKNRPPHTEKVLVVH
jgi:hypothetical protein